MYRKTFLFCLDKIKNDIVKLRKEKANFYFFQKEEILNVDTNELKICEYYPTTSCSCCNGITHSLIQINNGNDLFVPKGIELQ